MEPWKFVPDSLTIFELNFGNFYPKTLRSCIKKEIEFPR